MRSDPILVSTLAIACATMACADGTAPGARQSVSVSFMTVSTAPAAGSRSAVSASRGRQDVATNDALVIVRAQLVVARMELVRIGATCASDEPAGGDDHGDDRGCAELELAPTVVNLPVSGTLVDALTVNIPAGTYSELEAKIRPVRENSGRGHGSTTFLATHPELEGVSVLVQGTFNGEPFTFTSDVSIGAEQHFDPPLAVSDAPLKITVNLDLASWFASGTGALIDPRTASRGTENARLVGNNIKRSFRAFRDDDHDGHDDHGEHGEDGSRGHH